MSSTVSIPYTIPQINLTKRYDAVPMKKVAQLLINEELHPSTWQESLVLLCSSEINFEYLYIKTNTRNRKEKKKP